MGGTTWLYFVPYQPNVEEALQKLREEVFRKGEFPVESEDATPDSPAAARAMRKLKESNAKYRQTLLKHDKAKTIDGLLEVAGYPGTHSILDVRHVAEERVNADEYYVVVPASKSDLLKWFGTDKPTRSMIETSQEYENRFDWYPRYFIIYKDGLPNEICFAGVTGD